MKKASRCAAGGQFRDKGATTFHGETMKTWQPQGGLYNQKYNNFIKTTMTLKILKVKKDHIVETRERRIKAVN